MRKFRLAGAIGLTLLTTLVFLPAITPAQTPNFPQTLGANTVVGRLGIGSGPAQAIPFSTLLSNLLISFCTVSGAEIVYSDQGGAWQCSNSVSTTQTANSAPVSADCWGTVPLGGSAQFTYTFGTATTYPSNCWIVVKNTDADSGGRSKTLVVPGLPNCTLYPNQELLVRRVGNVWERPTCPRWRLTQNTTFNVWPTGSDSNDGLAASAAGAFQSAQTALSTILNNVDPNGFQVTIQHSCATPPCSITAASQLINIANGPDWTGPPIIYQGDTTTPANMELAPNGSVVADIRVTYPLRLQVQGFRLSGGANPGAGIYASGGATVNVIGKMEYNTLSTGGVPHMLANSGGKIFIASNYTVQGPAAFDLYASHGGVIEINSAITVTCNGAMAFTGAFAKADYGGVLSNLGSITFSSCGSVTGTRYFATVNGSIDVGGLGASFLPGNAAGIMSLNGRYSSPGTPTISACGGSPGTPTAGSTDMSGSVVEGTTATGCTITFTTANQPIACSVNVSSATAQAGLTISVSSTQLVVSHPSVSSIALFWNCPSQS